MATGGRETRAWRDLSARLRKTLPATCWICLEDIDLSLHHNDPRAWTLDHVDPLARGGELLDERNLRPAHRSCNAAKGIGQRPDTPGSKGNYSRRWR